MAGKRRYHGRRGLTLVELLIALSITAVIGAVLSVLINATAMGTRSQNDGRKSLVKMQAIKAQLEDTISNAQCVLATGTNYIVLWTGDIPEAPTPANGAVNLSELELIEIDTNTGNINLYTTSFPAAWSSSNIVSADTTYGAATTWYTACSTAKNSGYFNPTTIGTGATGMTVSLDTASPTTAKMATLVISISDSGYVSKQIVVGAALSNQAAPW